MQRLRPDLREDWDAAHQSFEIRVTQSFAARIDWSDVNDPLARQVLPDRAEIYGDSGLMDPVGDAKRSPVPWVVRKHDDRVLVLVTKQCHLHCRYCFRRTFSPGESIQPTPQEWTSVLEYLRETRPHEVILSGGDPLTLSGAKLLRVVDDIRPLCDVLRVHTRAPITQPSRVDKHLASELSRRGPLWFVVHCNHLNELSEDVRRALGELIDAGIPVLNQTVLLHGVNDNSDDLIALFRALVRLRVTPYYLHHPDRVAGAQHFWVPPERGLEIYKRLASELSGIACPKYVIDPPEGTGKVPVADWIQQRPTG